MTKLKNINELKNKIQVTHRENVPSNKTQTFTKDLALLTFT